MSIYQNNRFLKRINPEIVSAVNDSGSSLNHSELQKLMRQMVDLDIADNLKLWVHRDLVKTRFDGGDTFVSKAYDISGAENNAVQTIEANQPKIVTLGMEFDGTNAGLNCGNIFGNLSEITINFWCKFATVADGGTDATTIMMLIGKASAAATSLSNIDYCVYYDRRTINQKIIWQIVKDSSTITSSSVVNIPSVFGTSWNMITTTWSSSGTRIRQIFKNGSSLASDTNSVDTLQGTSQTLQIGDSESSRKMNGNLNDIRIFNKTLSSDEISAIYNLTKSYYGIE